MIRKHSNICPDCGAWLDPGEICDCEEEQQEHSRNSTFKRLKLIQAAEQRNSARIISYNQQRRREKDLHEYLYR